MADTPVVIMHALATPVTMQDDPRYDDVLLDVYDALADRTRRAVLLWLSHGRWWHAGNEMASEAGRPDPQHIGFH